MYVDAKLMDGRVYVSSYDESGERKVTTHLPPYTYYYADSSGTYKSIYGDKLKRARHTNRKTFKNDLQRHRSQGIPIFESDVQPVFRLLEERFTTNDTPPLKISILDIECDKDPTKGWSNVSSPYAIINAITIYNKWEDQYYTLCIAPPNMTKDDARTLLDSANEDDTFGQMTEKEGYFVCHGEAELLAMTFEIIQDADVLTGWNSSFFDLPYMIQRTRVVFGGEKLSYMEREGQRSTDPNHYGGVVPFKPSQDSIPWLKKFCLAEFDCLPEMRMIEKFGNPEKSFDIFGRIHIDYLELYRKFTFEELHSYTLDAILQREVKQTKVQYEGSLDQLYRNDFRTFVAYNRQDVAGLAAMDDKLKMIELANTMSHMAGVTFDKVFGSVAIIEQAILRELHRQDMICFDKNIENNEHVSVPGAFVVEPHKGLYEWIAAFDINSLYPSIIRCLNISPECVIGQFDPIRTDEKYERHILAGMTSTEAWAQFTGTLEYHSIIDETDEVVTLLIEPDPSGDLPDPIAATGKEWKRELRECNWAVSANGTVFDLEREGIVPYCLTKWYAQRQEWQAEKDARKTLIKDGAEGEELQRLKTEEKYYDMIQLVMKIFLNSTYGALLNRFCRFYDPRLGKSVTLTGRVITKHMIRYVSQCMTGEYDFDRRAIIYGDSVVGNTEIIVNGNRIAIESLFVTVKDENGGKQYDFPNASVLTYDDSENKTTYRPIKYIVRHAVGKRMFRVWWNNEHYIDVTEDHSLMGYVNTNNRRNGEIIISQVTPEEVGNKIKSLIHLQTVPREQIQNLEYSQELYEFLGYVLGDGNCQPMNNGGQHSGIGLSIGKGDINEVCTKLIDPLVEQGWITSYHTKKNGHDIRVCGTRLHTFVRKSLYADKVKSTPSWIELETEEHISAFLRGWFSADGTVLKNGSIVRLTTTRKILAKTAQRLLYFCGIASSYFTETTENSYNGVLSGTYSTHVVIKSREVFREKVGFILTRKESKQQREISRSKKNITDLDFELVVPTKIEEISHTGYVYDIEVDDTHTFFANDILVHNTDSAYCTLDWYMGNNNIEKTVPNAVEIADGIGEKINASFPQFMNEHCLVDKKRGAIIQAGREIVGRRGLFKDVKKRYAIHVVDLEGFATDKMKIMGMEVRRSDTPKFIQEFLTEAIEGVVKENKAHEEIYERVQEFRNEFRGMDPWKRGTPCRVSKLSINAKKIRNYEEARADGDVDIKKPIVHFSVAAANNTNRLMEQFSEHRWDLIRDGDKIEVLYLRPNQYDIKSVAIKVGENYVPDWFKDLPFDNERHEAKLLDKKLDNMIGSVLDWSFAPVQDHQNEVFEEVDFFA